MIAALIDGANELDISNAMRSSCSRSSCRLGPELQPPPTLKPPPQAQLGCLNPAARDQGLLRVEAPYGGAASPETPPCATKSPYNPVRKSRRTSSSAGMASGAASSIAWSAAPGLRHLREARPHPLSDCALSLYFAFSCKGRGLCPSCGAKRAASWWRGFFLQDENVADVGHAQWVFTVPKLLRPTPFLAGGARLLLSAGITPGSACTTPSPFQPVTAAPSRLSPATACIAPSASPACAGRRGQTPPPICPGTATTSDKASDPRCPRLRRPTPRARSRPEKAPRPLLRRLFQRRARKAEGSRPGSASRAARLGTGRPFPAAARLRAPVVGRSSARLGPAPKTRVRDRSARLSPLPGRDADRLLHNRGRVIRRILDHLGASARRATQDRAPPLAAAPVPDSL